MPRALVVAVVIAGIVLTFTAIPAPFTIDENNYLVTVLGLRAGKLTVPGTEGLPPTRELLYFDPSGYRREVHSTPVSSTAPPLYAAIAVPFSYLGFRGLIALNTVAFMATILLTFAIARRGATTPEGPWIAAVAVAAGAYFIEYAQGMWPHMLSVALITGAVLLTLRAIEEGDRRAAAAAGFLAATATGVRYQNAFLIFCLGLGLILLSKRRVTTAAALALGAALPLLACSIANQIRLDSWNPISKGTGYLVTPRKMATAAKGNFVGSTATLAWTRVVDYTAQPPIPGSVHESVLTRQPRSGAYVVVTAVKKAWLQSSPWMIVPLVLLALAWLPSPLLHARLGMQPPALRALRLFALMVVLTIGMFSAAGPRRTDGLCFNQRYFCELVPPMAVALAWGVERLGTRRTAMLGGGLAGAALAFASVQLHHLAPLRHHLVRYLPLFFALVLGVVWILRWAGRAESRRLSNATAAALGVCLAWSLAIHLGDDLQASRILRLSREDQLRQLRPYVRDRSAIFSSGAIKDALGPLQMDSDLVIAVPGHDQGAKSVELLDALLARGRNVFVLPNALPPEKMDVLLEGRQIRGLGDPVMMMEVRSDAATAEGG